MSAVCSPQHIYGALTVDHYHAFQLHSISLIFHAEALISQSFSLMLINPSVKSDLSSLIHAGTADTAHDNL